MGRAVLAPKRLNFLIPLQAPSQGGWGLGGGGCPSEPVSLLGCVVTVYVEVKKHICPNSVLQHMYQCIFLQPPVTYTDTVYFPRHYVGLYSHKCQNKGLDAILLLSRLNDLTIYITQ